MARVFSAITPAGWIGVGFALGTAALAGLEAPGWGWGICGAVALACFVIAGFQQFRVRRYSNLRKRCREHSGAIYEFLGDRHVDDPSHIPHWTGLPHEASETEKNKSFSD